MDGAYMMNGFRASCRLTLLCIAVALFTACSDSKQTSPETITPAKITAKMHQEIKSIITDPARAQQVISLSDQLNIIIVEAVQERDKKSAMIRSMNANYDTTKAEFETLLNTINAKEKQRYMKVLAINTEMKKILTSQEWKQLHDIREEILKKDIKLL